MKKFYSDFAFDEKEILLLIPVQILISVSRFDDKYLILCVTFTLSTNINKSTDNMAIDFSWIDT